MRGESAWSFVISAVRTMKAKGATKTIAVAISREWFATATRKRWRRTAGGGLRRMRAAGPTGRLAELISAGRRRVVDPAPRVEQDREHDHEGDAEQEHRDRGRVAHVEVDEPLLVEQHGVEERRVLRVAEVVDRVACL